MRNADSADKQGMKELWSRHDYVKCSHPGRHITAGFDNVIESWKVCALISHKVVWKSFCISHLPHKSVNLSSTITNIKNKLTDLCGD